MENKIESFKSIPFTSNFEIINNVKYSIKNLDISKWKLCCIGNNSNIITNIDNLNMCFDNESTFFIKIWNRYYIYFSTIILSKDWTEEVNIDNVTFEYSEEKGVFIDKSNDIIKWTILEDFIINDYFEFKNWKLIDTRIENWFTKITSTFSNVTNEFVKQILEIKKWLIYWVPTIVLLAYLSNIWLNEYQKNQNNNIKIQMNNNDNFLSKYNSLEYEVTEIEDLLLILKNEFDIKDVIKIINYLKIKWYNDNEQKIWDKIRFYEDKVNITPEIEVIIENEWIFYCFRFNQENKEITNFEKKRII